jgi:serine/threonine-protein kinase
MSIHAGTSLGRYQIHSLLGTGGMGEVYLAQDTNLGRRVALKLLPSEFTKDESPALPAGSRAASAIESPEYSHHS